MKKSKKLVIWILFLLIFAVIGFAIVYSIFKDESRLSSIENEWVNNNLNKIQNVSVINNANVFGTNGSGVFYDFIKDFALKYNVKLNPITYNNNEVPTGIRFGISNETTENDVLFYDDHYVLVSKSEEFITDKSSLNNRKIGVLADSFDYITENINLTPTLLSYESNSKLIEALNAADISAILVPRIEFMDTILTKEYYIIHHFSTLHRYYNLSKDEKDNEMLSNVLSKYFVSWEKDNLRNALHQQEFQLFTKSLNISQTEIDKLQSIVYNYGFLQNSPYEVLTGGNYGGILANYLNEFSEFSQVEFNFKKFSNYKKLVSAINENKVDLYFGYQNYTATGKDVASNILTHYDVLVPESNFFVVDSLKSLSNKTVYVENNSLLHSKLTSLKNLKLETYESDKGLKNVIKNKGILIMDSSVSDIYQKTLLQNYSVRYTSGFPDSYNFKVHSSDVFVKLFTKYLDYLDSNTMIYQGKYNYFVTMKNGTILGTIAQYFLYLLAICAVILYLIYRSSKRIRLVKKIKKEDRLKFIDQLTSLKNRNYLNDNIFHWNKNTIYPQTMIVIDLNSVQEINDTLGYESGDAQIKAAANALIKTQLDNSDIMRTDGNEFMIYLVGYQTKQISSFIHKLNKEFKNLPSQYGACIGYSMIMDDIKSIEDAINEAIEDVKKQKSNKTEEHDI